MTTEGVASLMPFRTQEVRDKGGVCYGKNAVSGNLIICDRKCLPNGNGFILGTSGSGKSMSAKDEIGAIALNTEDDIIVVDPEREYSPLIREMGGEIVHISANSRNHINALDVNKDCAEDENPIAIKSEFLMSLFEQIMGAGKVGAKEKSIIDSCTRVLLTDYMLGKTNVQPTLPNFRAELLKREGAEARDLAMALEMFSEGTLNVFAHESNVDMNNRILLYDIFDLGKQLKPVGMLVMLDAIMNRVIENRKRNKRTWIYLDEIYLFFQNEFSGNFLAQAWRRYRKYGALATGITQNVEDCLRSDTARTMLANSEFLLMLKQAPTDLVELTHLLNISEMQMGHIKNAEPGHGLVKVGSALVPFKNDIDKDTVPLLYRLISTKPGES
jgi:type IV secretory pathway VirB4 component